MQFGTKRTFVDIQEIVLLCNKRIYVLGILEQKSPLIHVYTETYMYKRARIYINVRLLVFVDIGG